MPKYGFGNHEVDILRSARRHFKCGDVMLSNVFKNDADVEIAHIWFLKSLDTPLHSACRLKIPNQESGGFKKMWKHNSVARLLAHCATPRVKQMVLKEILIQQFLSKYDFVPNIISFKVSCSGSLTLPIYEALIEMPLLQKTLMSFLNSSPSLEEVQEMLAQVLSAIYTLNTANFLHNDLKPDNLMCLDVDEFEFTDSFNIRSFKSKCRWHIIDFGLCTMTGQGDDLFFFCWWLYHRAFKLLETCNLLACFRWVLFVPKSEIPAHLFEHIHCEMTNTHVNFAAPLKKRHTRDNNVWISTYGMTKETLYALAQQKSGGNDVETLLRNIYDPSFMPL